MDIETGIDRSALVGYVRDGYAANALSAEIDRLISLADGAETWFVLAEGLTGDATEARINARRVAGLIRDAIPKLRARLAGMEDEVPSFPTALYAAPGWKRFAGDLIDSLVVRATYLLEESQLRALEDWPGLLQLSEAREADLMAFDLAGAAYNRRLLAILPKGHPENVLLQLYALSDRVRAFYHAEAPESDPVDEEEAAANRARAMNKAAAEMEALAPVLEATLDDHRAAMGPILLTLACDESEAEKAREAYLDTYRALVPLIRDMADLVREGARIEIDLARSGASAELLERLERLSFREGQAVKAINELWSARAEILAGAIAEE